jgi:hypothetical protein
MRTCPEESPGDYLRQAAGPAPVGDTPRVTDPSRHVADETPQAVVSDQLADAGAAKPNGGRPTPGPPRAKRPILERIGLAFIALVLAALFGAVATAAWAGGELFLAAMGAIGCLMTLWVGGLTLFRG